MQAHVHTLAGLDHRTVADNRRATDVNTEAIDCQSALQGAHVVRPLTVAKYPPTDTTLSPFLYFSYAGLTTLLYLILGYLLLLYTQLISFLVSLDYGFYDPCVSPSATRQRHHNGGIPEWDEWMEICLQLILGPVLIQGEPRIFLRGSCCEETC